MKTDDQTSTTESQPAEKRSGGWGTFFFRFFCLLCFAAIGLGGYYGYTEFQRLDTTVAEGSGDFDQFVAKQRERDAEIDGGLASLNTSLAATEAANQAVAQSVGGLADQISKLHTGFDQAIAGLRGQQEQTDASLASLSQKSSAQERTIGAVEKAVAKNAGGLVTLTADLSGQSERLDSLDTSYASAEATIKEMGGVIAQLEQRYTDVQGELASVKDNYGDQQGQITELNTAFAQVKHELAAARESAAPDEAVATAFENSEIPAVDAADAGEADGFDVVGAGVDAAQAQ